MDKNFGNNWNIPSKINIPDANTQSYRWGWLFTDRPDHRSLNMVNHDLEELLRSEIRDEIKIIEYMTAAESIRIPRAIVDMYIAIYNEVAKIQEPIDAKRAIVTNALDIKNAMRKKRLQQLDKEAENLKASKIYSSFIQLKALIVEYLGDNILDPGISAQNIPLNPNQPPEP